MNLENQKSFTLLEILIVISIIAILAVTIIPNFIGFDTEARLAASKTNLSTLRTRVTLFRTKEGRYPKNLDELLEVTYSDLGIEKPYLDKMPTELISSNEGSSETITLKSDDELPSDGGWAYIKDRAKVIIDWDKELDSKWSQAEGEKPSDW